MFADNILEFMASPIGLLPQHSNLHDGQLSGDSAALIIPLARLRLLGLTQPRPQRGQLLVMVLSALPDVLDAKVHQTLEGTQPKAFVAMAKVEIVKTELGLADGAARRLPRSRSSWAEDRNARSP